MRFVVSPYLRVIEALNAANVRYVIVGGVAVVLHGVNRFTADLDLIIDLSPSEARKAIDALLRLGFRNRLPVDAYDFVNDDIRRAWIREKNLTVFSLFDPRQPQVVIDLFAESPIAFEELYGRSGLVDLGRTSARLCSLDDLIQMKRISARPVDDSDIRDLEQVDPRKKKA